MAEVYRARDSRLQRDVAVKIVGEALHTDVGFLARLEQEARLAGSLNHPNIVSVHDVGSHDGAPYVVTELLQGETLRERLAKGTVPLPSALDWAVQIAKGLAAAHEHGIVHRDLKPENVFLTRSGEIKLLDFGIAKALAALPESRGLLEPTLSPAGSVTSTGVVLGTPGYMSPEQVRGEPVDGRSDIFSAGAILYELLSGQRPFRTGTAVETGYAILHEAPPALPPSVPAPIAQFVHRCLEKDPDQRFQSARDLAFSLDALRTVSGPVITLSTEARSSSRQRAPRWLVWPILALLLATLGVFVARSWTLPRQPTVRQLTFRRGAILGARFAPDGRTVHFSASWGGGAPEIYSTSVDSPEIRSLGFGDAQLLAVSRSGELALSLRPVPPIYDNPRGTLARVPLGGTPRELDTNVEYADWAPDGERLAVVRLEQGKRRLEFPAGEVRFESTGWISHPRVSPSGDRVAFINHPTSGTAGEVVVVGPGGRDEAWTTATFDDLIGLAWKPGGDELLVTGAQPRELAALWAVRRGRAPRPVYRAPRSLLINDVSRDGRVLLTGRDWQKEIELFHVADNRATPLEWLDWASVSGLSDDGSAVLFFESGIAAGDEGLIFLRNPAQPAPVKLGVGRSLDLSPDGKWALAEREDSPGKLWLLPTGVGVARSVDAPGLERIAGAAFFQDGKRAALLAQPPGSLLQRLYVLELEGGKLRPISPPLEFDLLAGAVSPDQRWVAFRASDGIVTAFPVDGGEPMRAVELGPGYRVIGWLPDGSLLAFEQAAVPARVRRYDPRSRTSSLFTTLAPADRAGVTRIIKARSSADGRTIAFDFRRMGGALFELDWGGSPP
jgi:hypothetical protein